jgi:AcrR family transcriptional regulator
MTLLSARDGYATVTTARIIARAGVSRPTFYEHFTDREDCLVAALAPIRRRLQREVRAAIGKESPGRRAGAVAAALVAFAISDPVIARVAFSETLAAGHRGLRARDEMLAGLAVLIEDSYRDAAPGTPAPDIPSRVLIGALSRMLAVRLAEGEPVTGALALELTGWLASYDVPLREHRWRAMRAVSPATQPPLPGARPMRAPATPAARGVRVSHERACEQQRLRIMFATVEAVGEHGYHAATVAAIARRAGLDTRSFYRLFAGKQDALHAAGEMLFGHLMAVSAGAFVTAEDWPERVWRAVAAFAQAVQVNPALAGVALLDSHAAGSHAARRVQEASGAFTIFLEEGFRYESTRERPSQTCLQALAAAVFELCYQAARCGESPELSALLPHIAFILLAPFLGAAQTNGFLRSHVAAAEHAGRGVSEPAGHALAQASTA